MLKRLRIAFLLLFATVGIAVAQDRHDEQAAQAPGKRVDPCATLSFRGEVRFSYWGYRHNEAHCKGWVAQLQETTSNKCCSGESSGECRVSRYSAETGKVEIDGIWCPLYSGTLRGQVYGLEPDLVLLCAGKVLRNEYGTPQCPNTYCIGGSDGS